MKLIVGLGNPGIKYQDTRHNVGHMTVDKLARELSFDKLVWQRNNLSQSSLIKIADVILVKPETYVNKSGLAVKALTDFYKLDPIDIWVIHDDIDLPFGKIRIRYAGGSGGHNGVDSIIKNLKTDKFTRFRLGIGRGKVSLGDNFDKNLSHRKVISFVLSKFKAHEAGQFRHLIDHAVEAVRMSLIDGIDKAMNKFN